jgi:hypothetical protein
MDGLSLGETLELLVLPIQRLSCWNVIEKRGGIEREKVVCSCTDRPPRYTKQHRRLGEKHEL